MAGVLITYKGTTISNLTASGQKTLLTAGKYCEANIGIDYTGADIEVTSALGANAFKGAAGITAVSVNNTVSAIGASCFQNCTGLTTVSGFASLTTIGASAFQGCTALTTLPTTPTVTSIGDSAFEGCTALTSFNMSTNVSALSFRIFYGCTSLTSIEIHGTVNNFNPNGNGNSLIFNSSALASVILPGGSYGGYVITNCANLRNVTLGGPGNPVSSIGYYAFSYCTGPITYRVYTENAQVLPVNSSSNYWGSNTHGTNCTFIDSEDETHTNYISF